MNYRYIIDITPMENLKVLMTTGYASGTSKTLERLMCYKFLMDISGKGFDALKKNHCPSLIYAEVRGRSKNWVK